jgi:N-acetylglucosaminyldiphosphoundecaprenol N-acetyl-beta-D-mannosaminyltransferase
MTSQSDSFKEAADAPVAILGVPFDPVTAAEAVARIEEMIAAASPHFLVTANVDFLVQARKDVELHRIFLNADMVLCDGTPIVWASRWLGTALPERVAGADLVPLLIESAARKGYRLFFLGASPDSAQQAITRLRAQYPGLSVECYSPPFSNLLEMDHEECRRRISAARPDMLFVAFGCPKQEKWMAMHYRALGVPVMIGVGGTIDFLAGRIRRAPRWMQRIGSEWLFRLAQEPRRLFRRYLRDLWNFGWAFLAEWWSLRRRRTRAQESSFAAALDVAEAEASQITSDALLDLSGVTRIQSSCLGRLLRFERRVRVAGGLLFLVTPNRAFCKVLAQTRLQHFFSVSPTPAAARALMKQRAQTSAPAAVLLPPNGMGLAWRGEITAATSETIWKETCLVLRRVLASGPWNIDLSDVSYIDSTGLGVMVRAKKLAQQQQQDLWFSCPQLPVRNVLHLAGLERLLLKGRSKRVPSRKDLSSLQFSEV